MQYRRISFCTPQIFLQGQSRAKSPERPAKQGEKGAKGSLRVWKELLSAIS